MEEILKELLEARSNLNQLREHLVEEKKNKYPGQPGIIWQQALNLGIEAYTTGMDYVTDIINKYQK